MADKQYVGKGKEHKFDNGGSVVKINLDMSAMPPPNEKGWVHLVVAQMRQADKYGNTHTVYVNDWKPKDAQPETPANDDMPF